LMVVQPKSSEMWVVTQNILHVPKPNWRSPTKMPWTEAWLKRDLALGFWKLHQHPVKASTVPTMSVELHLPLDLGLGPEQALGQVQEEAALMLLALDSAWTSHHHHLLPPVTIADFKAGPQVVLQLSYHCWLYTLQLHNTQKLIRQEKKRMTFFRFACVW